VQPAPEPSAPGHIEPATESDAGELNDKKRDHKSRATRFAAPIAKAAAPAPAAALALTAAPAAAAPATPAAPAPAPAAPAATSANAWDRGAFGGRHWISYDSRR
jgi:hypothetical protein